MRAAVVLACLGLAGCGAPIAAQIDTADQSAGVTVDGWGVELSCKADHLCVVTPVGPVCFPMPGKVCAWL